jgi:uncharacterized protein YigA (DUF484 family)
VAAGVHACRSGRHLAARTRRDYLFADPEFFRKHATQVNLLTHELDAAKEKDSRWEELEAIRSANR